jgi:hypothetical protein
MENKENKVVDNSEEKKVIEMSETKAEGVKVEVKKTIPSSVKNFMKKNWKKVVIGLGGLAAIGAGGYILYRKFKGEDTSDVEQVIDEMNEIGEDVVNQ